MIFERTIFYNSGLSVKINFDVRSSNNFYKTPFLSLTTSRKNCYYTFHLLIKISILGSFISDVLGTYTRAMYTNSAPWCATMVATSFITCNEQQSNDQICLCFVIIIITNKTTI